MLPLHRLSNAVSKSCSCRRVDCYWRGVTPVTFLETTLLLREHTRHRARPAPAMAAGMARTLLAALALLSLVAPAAAVEVCKVVDLKLVTQTGEFFLAGANALLYYPRHLALPWPLKHSAGADGVRPCSSRWETRGCAAQTLNGRRSGSKCDVADDAGD